MPRRNGVTRSELLVGLLIAVLVIATFIAAMLRIRESAQSMSCRNNLKQLGLALHNYVDCNERLPPLTDQGEGAPTGRGLPSVFANLVPFVEATPEVFKPERSAEFYHAHSSVKFTYDCKGMPYTQVGGMANGTWKVFLDPVDDTAVKLRDVPMVLPDGTTGYYASASYAANGMLPWGTGGFRHITRGLPETILFGERPQVCRTADGDTVYNLWGLGFYSPHMPAFAALTPAEPPGMLSTEQIAPALPFPDENAVDRNSLIRVRIGRRDAEPQLLDVGSPVRSLRRGRPCDPRLPASSHYEGMQVAMADGSVRVFGYDTDPWVFWADCVPSPGTGDRHP